MTSIDDIRRFADRSLEGELRRLCIQIIDEVANRARRQDDLRWTFQNFAAWTEVAPSSDLLQQSVLILASMEDRKLLDMHYFFFDPDLIDNVGEEIEDEEVAHAYESGYLINPHSGKQIADFEQHLSPFFKPSRELQI